MPRQFNHVGTNGKEETGNDRKPVSRMWLLTEETTTPANTFIEVANAKPCVHRLMFNDNKKSSEGLLVSSPLQNEGSKIEHEGPSK